MAAKSSAKSSQLLVAVESFAIETGRREDDTPVMVIFRGDITRVRADDVIVKGREHLFSPVSKSEDV